MDSCLADERCRAFTFDRENRFNSGNCWLKYAAKNFNDYRGLTSGVRCDLENAPQTRADKKYPDTGKLNDINSNNGVWSL